MKDETIKFELKPLRSHGFMNTTPNMGRVYIELPLDEARQLHNVLNNKSLLECLYNSANKL